MQILPKTTNEKLGKIRRFFLSQGGSTWRKEKSSGEVVLDL